MNLCTHFALVFEYCAISGIIMPRMAENAKPSAKLLKRLKTKYVFVRFEYESLYLFCIGFSILCHFWHNYAQNGSEWLNTQNPVQNY